MLAAAQELLAENNLQRHDRLFVKRLACRNDINDILRDHLERFPSDES